eukprot:m.19866 g.19866  ORF g.19866 m.19866 type:complete len:302 (-) comp6033_c0_seq2:2558-3463(-)
MRPSQTQGPGTTDSGSFRAFARSFLGKRVSFWLPKVGRGCGVIDGANVLVEQHLCQVIFLHNANADTFGHVGNHFLHNVLAKKHDVLKDNDKCKLCSRHLVEKCAIFSSDGLTQACVAAVDLAWVGTQDVFQRCVWRDAVSKANQTASLVAPNQLDDNVARKCNHKAVGDDADPRDGLHDALPDTNVFSEKPRWSSKGLDVLSCVDTDFQNVVGEGEKGPKRKGSDKQCDKTKLNDHLQILVKQAHLRVRHILQQLAFPRKNVVAAKCLPALGAAKAPRRNGWNHNLLEVVHGLFANHDDD